MQGWQEQVTRVITDKLVARARMRAPRWLYLFLSSLLVLSAVASRSVDAACQWTQVEPYMFLPNGHFTKVTYGAGTVVAVGVNVTGCCDERGVIYASRDGLTFTQVFSSAKANYYSGVAWSGQSFVAVSTGYAALSQDGLNWTEVPIPLPVGGSVGLYGVGWAGQFVAVGLAGMLLTSPDGVTWTQRISCTSSDLYGVGWDGTKIVAVGGGAICESYDGVGWQSAQNTGGASGLRAAVASASLSPYPGQPLFIAVGSGSIVGSLGGGSWTPYPLPEGLQAEDVAASPAIFVAVGQTGVTTPIAATSPNGIDWTRDNSFNAWVHGICWTGQSFFVVGDGGFIARRDCPGSPQADFTWSPTNPQVNETIQFTDTSTGSPTSWSWDFGDGGTSSQQNPAHTYSSAGTYTVTLTVSNESGSNSTNRAVTVTSQQAVITSVEPNRLPSGSGCPVRLRITGNALDSATAIYLGDPSVPLQSVNITGQTGGATTITGEVTVPAGWAPGTYQLVVQTPAGEQEFGIQVFSRRSVAVGGAYAWVLGRDAAAHPSDQAGEATALVWNISLNPAGIHDILIHLRGTVQLGTFDTFLEDLISQAHAAGMRIHAWCVDYQGTDPVTKDSPVFVPDGVQLIKTQVQQVLNWNAVHPKTQFDGIHLNIEDPVAKGGDEFAMTQLFSDLQQMVGDLILSESAELVDPSLRGVTGIDYCNLSQYVDVLMPQLYITGRCDSPTSDGTPIGTGCVTLSSIQSYWAKQLNDNAHHPSAAIVPGLAAVDTALLQRPTGTGNPPLCSSSSSFQTEAYFEFPRNAFVDPKNDSPDLPQVGFTIDRFGTPESTCDYTSAAGMSAEWFKYTAVPYFPGSTAGQRSDWVEVYQRTGVPRVNNAAAWGFPSFAYWNYEALASRSTAGSVAVENAGGKASASNPSAGGLILTFRAYQGAQSLRALELSTCSTTVGIFDPQGHLFQQVTLPLNQTVEVQVPNAAAGTWSFSFSSNCGGGVQVDYQVGRDIFVAPACTQTAAPAASFTWGPQGPLASQPQQQQPYAGQAVTFTDTSTGSPTSWAWAFGDGGTSSQQNPAHAYAAAKTYTVTLTASNCRGSNQTSQQITVLPLQSPEAVMTVDAAKVNGLNGTSWRTNVRIFNPSSQSSKVTVEFLPVNVGLPSGPGESTTLVPNATWVIDDILGTALTNGYVGAGVTKAALRFTYDNADNTPPVVVSDTYTSPPSGGGTYGQLTPGIKVVPGSTPPVLWLAGIRNNGTTTGFRTNYSLVNLRSDVGVQNLKFTLFDQTGTPIATQTTSMNTLEYRQDSLANLFGGAAAAVSPDPLAVRVDVPAGSDIQAYVSVMDNLTGDPVLIPAVPPPTSPIFLPGVGHTPGLNGTVWRSDLQITNPDSAAPHTWDITYLPRSGDSLPIVSRTVTLAPQATTRMDDLLSWVYSNLLSADASTSGMVRIAPADGSLVYPIVQARSFNQTPNGTFGQNITPVTADMGVAAGQGQRLLLIGMSSQDIARTNLGFVDLSDTSSVVFSVLFYDEGGNLLNPNDGQGNPIPYTISLGVGGWDQDLLENRFKNTTGFPALGSNLRAISAVIQVTGGGPGTAYATVIDSQTGDPNFILAQPAQ